MGQIQPVEGWKYLNTMSNICGLLLILVFGPTHLGAASLSPLQSLRFLRFSDVNSEQSDVDDYLQHFLT